MGFALGEGLSDLVLVAWFVGCFVSLVPFVVQVLWWVLGSVRFEVTCEAGLVFGRLFRRGRGLGR